jgi:hypothetical protein
MNFGNRFIESGHFGMIEQFKFTKLLTRIRSGYY